MAKNANEEKSQKLIFKSPLQENQNSNKKSQILNQVLQHTEDMSKKIKDLKNPTQRTSEDTQEQRRKTDPQKEAFLEKVKEQIGFFSQNLVREMGKLYDREKEDFSKDFGQAYYDKKQGLLQSFSNEVEHLNQKVLIPQLQKLLSEAFEKQIRSLENSQIVSIKEIEKQISQQKSLSLTIDQIFSTHSKTSKKLDDVMAQYEDLQTQFGVKGENHFESNFEGLQKEVRRLQNTQEDFQKKLDSVLAVVESIEQSLN